MSLSSMLTPPGTLINERYRLDQEIGRGGMGTVYHGWDTLLQRKVAIKVLYQDALGHGGTDRLLNEARVIARLDHPNIVTLFDAGEMDGVPFLVMQLIEGRNLGTDPQSDLQETISIAVQICSALSHAHANGVIHRDLKPENVFLADDSSEGAAAHYQRVRIVDFGIAHSDLARMTIQGEITGTVDYMAPEQALGQDTSPKTDLYALGVILYEMCTGELPYRGDNPLSVISQHINAPVKSPKKIVPDLPTELDDLILRLLSKTPHDRPTSAHEVENILRDYWHLEENLLPAAATPELGGGIKYNLPTQITSFVGREDEITEVSQLIMEADCHLLTLAGPGGIGKTRLGIEAAAQLKEAFRDGIFFVSLGPISAPDFILPAVAEALDLSLHTHGSVDPRRQLFDYLENRNVLLVLDNYEHLIDGTEMLIELLKHAPAVKLLVTSRQRLNVQGEWVFNVSGLRIPQNGSPQDKDGSSAVDLFIERARSADSRFAVNEEARQHVVHICQMVAGIPLGIELASAWVNVLSLKEIATEIGKSLDFLVSTKGDLPVKHRSMRAAFDYSWELLTEKQRQVFRKLSVFYGGFDRQAAQQVAGAGLIDLSSLVDRSFLRRIKEDRYEIHELLRQYGHDKLQESQEEFEKICNHHCTYYLEFLDHNKHGLSGERQLEARTAVHAEIENIRAAIRWCIRVGDEQRVRSALGILSDFYLLRGYYEGVETYKNIARIIEDQYPSCFDPKTRGTLMEVTALTYQMFFLSMLGSIEVSEEIGQKILPVLRELDIDKELAFCLMSVGINCSYRGEYKTGEQNLQEALRKAIQIKDFVGVIGCGIWLGWVHYEAGDHGSALHQWEKGQDLSFKIKNRLMLAFVQSKIALLGEETGDYENAIRVQLEARENFRYFGDQVGIGYATSRLTLSLMGIGEYQEAKRVGQESFMCFKEMNHRWGIPASLCRIGFAEIELGENQEAWNHFSEALALSQKGQIDTLVLYALVGLGKLLVRQTQVEQGIEILSFVIANPSTPSLYRKFAEQGLAEVESNISLEEFSLYKERSEQLSLEEVLLLLPDVLFEPKVEVGA